MGKPMSTVYVPDEYGRLVPTQVPTWIGFVGWYAGPEPPEGYLYCDGSAIGRETYSELFEAVGTLYGAGDGVSTFELPDARGVFFRGDGGENSAAMGVRQGDAIREINGSVYFRTQVDGKGNRGQLMSSASGCLVYTSPEESVLDGLPNSSVGHGVQKLTFSAERVVPIASENRPINLAMKPCIRYI